MIIWLIGFGFMFLVVSVFWVFEILKYVLMVYIFWFVWKVVNLWLSVVDVGIKVSGFFVGFWVYLFNFKVWVMIM